MAIADPQEPRIAGGSRTYGSFAPPRGKGLPPPASARRRDGVQSAKEPSPERWHIACFNDCAMKLHSLFIGASILCVAVKPLAQAFETVDLQSIRQTAESAVRAALPGNADSISLEAGTLDPRLHLPACDETLQGAIAGDGKLRPRTLVSVTCTAPSRWNIFVSVAINSEPLVLRATRTLARGEALQGADFEATRVRVSGLSDEYVTDVSQLTDRVLRRPVASGEALALDALSPRKLIHRGEQLTLIARVGGVEVRTTGVALSDGEQDQRIRVQNQSTQRVVEGIVKTVNLVEVPL
ncbi:MAG: flagellar basal body P-ring formation chaperone FlgA [Steroidobacteraceae bacterium]